MVSDDKPMTIHEALEWTYSLSRLWSQIEYIQAHPEEFL